MLKTTHRYEQTAARLVVEGFPDLSAGQEGDTIGILSGWLELLFLAKQPLLLVLLLDLRVLLLAFLGFPSLLRGDRGGVHDRRARRVNPSRNREGRWLCSEASNLLRSRRRTMDGQPAYSKHLGFSGIMTR